MSMLQLKKDYVPGYGDTIDLVVVAAGWDKDRARELRGRSSCCFVGMMSEDVFSSVTPSTLTTFYVGALGNSSQMAANVSCVVALKLPLLHFPAAGYQTLFCDLFYGIVWLDTRTAGGVQLLDEGRHSGIPGMFRNIRADQLAH